MRLAPAFAALAAALAPLAAHADASPSDAGATTFRPMAGFAFTAGGEPLVHVVILNQQDGSYMGSTAVKAGGQDYLYLGGELRMPAARLTLQGTAGYHWDSKAGIGLDVTFSRVPYELVALYQPLNWLRVGGGVRYDTRVHMNGKFNAADPQYQLHFANAFGPVLKTEFVVNPDFGITMQWSKVDYKLRSQGGEDVSDLGVKADGRSFGVGAEIHF